MGCTSNNIESSGLSHVGPVREENQDTICLFEELGDNKGALFAVADGMGGYSHGKWASTLAIESLTSTFSNEKGTPEKRLIRGVESANLDIFQISQQLGVGRMGTTLTAAYLDGRFLTLVHVGDSRAYLIRGNSVRCLTRDHTIVGDLVRMKIIPSDKIRNHSQRSVLTRGVGLAPFVQPDITRQELKESDIVILCSDGLWSVIEDDELTGICSESNGISQVVDRLLNLAISRGTDDNISAVGIRIRSLPAGAQKPGTKGWRRIWSIGEKS